MNTFRSVITKSSLYPLAALESILPRASRMKLIAYLGWGALFLFLGAALFHTAPQAKHLAGIGLVVIGATLALFMAEWYFRSLYFHARGIHTTEGKEALVSLTVLSIVTRARKDDFVKGLLQSKIGKVFAARLGLSPKDIAAFLRKRGYKKTDLALTDTDHSPWYSLEDFVAELIAVDESFAEFLFTHAITKEPASRTAGWVARMREAEINTDFWWSDTRLASLPVLGATLHRGDTRLLDSYATAPSYTSSSTLLESDTLARIISGLTKSRESNVLIVGPFDAHTLSAMLSSAITQKSVPSMLKDKRVLILDTDLLIAHTGTKQAFETTLRKVMDEAHRAGNIILVIPRLHAFLSSASTIGSDLRSLLDPYLSGSTVSYIALSDTRTYTHELEKDATLLRRFETIQSQRITGGQLSILLEADIARLEQEHGVFFTYPAIVEVLTATERYFSGEYPEDKALDIITEAAARGAIERSHTITPGIIHTLVSEKTGVPAGELSDTERLVLADLESLLHKQVIGQDEAISGVAQALRRARAGVRDSEKPMGSFLFFGPTGVGKTETAKALARVFFGSEGALLRLDMSEYREGNALSRLIGTPAGEPGILATMIRQQPYGVLLLDEFEKTNPNVHDLFLQILDEGMFTDGEGRPVNARNILFIATSNAGSDMIWKATEEGRDLANEHDAFIEKLISEGLFKPEFLNRFSGAILFHPLSPSDIQKIAELMLGKLSKRMEREGIKVSFTPDMAEHVGREGYDRAFGARPMKRYIEQHIEQYIADGIIRGTITRGKSITLSPKDIG